MDWLHWLLLGLLTIFVVMHFLFAWTAYKENMELKRELAKHTSETERS